ncbi:MAG: MFS transporter [Azospirillaceae bacterium]|nr:MFS transporter [Azospirillaceae bacterium]
MKKIRNLRWRMLALMLVGTVIIYIDRNTLGVLAPVLKEALHFSTEQYSFVVSAFQISYSFTQPIAGYVIDVVGPRFGYAATALVWGAACALHALSGNWQMMAGFRSLLGISEAATMPTATKVSTLWFPARERSVATGWFNSGTSVGAMIAPPFVIWLSLHWGWKPAFVIIGLLSAVLSAVWFWFYRNPEDDTRLTDTERLYIGDGAAPVILPRPSLKHVLRQPKFYGILIARFLTEPAWQTFAFWIPLYMVSVRGMDIKQFALFAWMPFLTSDLGCIGGGYLAPFVHKHLKLSLVNARLTVITFGALCMIGPALISFAVSPVLAIMCFCLGGFAHQMLSSMLYAVMGDVFEKQDIATATGAAGMFGYLGGALFTLVVGQLADTLGYEPLFALLFLFDLVAAAALWLMIGEWGARKRSAAYAAE